MSSLTKNMLFIFPAIVGRESNGQRFPLVAVVSAGPYGLADRDTGSDVVDGFSGMICDENGGLRVEP
jgi:hypothetical protein